ncbi:uncharacterized protein LOC136094122 [Hydra vulgaris]|uniref:uncharacterized protein LOC136094122 n=1 Tax=Hydra vulgaris TaxID=6087 RepID=UPI0032EA8BFE
MNNKPDIIAISETRLNYDKTLRTDINLNGYVFEHTDSHSNKGGTLIYIKSELKYNLRSDLIIQEKKELESTFIELLLPSEKNIIVGCIYRPCMNTNDFNITHMQTLLDKLSLENKNIVLLGDFNINLLKYDSCNDVSNFLDLMCSFSLFPLITQPTRITPKSKTLIDNIFVNFQTPNTKSGNLTVSLADHLIQFISLPCKNLKQSSPKIYRRCFKNFDDKKFLKDLKKTDWLLINQYENYDVNNSTSKFLDIVKRLLDKHAPFKMFNKKATKSLSKPWITNGIITSIKIKNKLHKKYIKCKLKYFQKFKYYRNQISNLLRYSKKTYYSTYFNQNLNNLKNTWKVIKSIISIKSKNSNNIDSLNINNKTIINKKIISNAFNDYFSSIADNLAKKIIPPRFDFNHYLKNKNPNSLFISPVTSQEINDYISLINPKKSTGPNSILSKIMILASQELTFPLSIIINQSFQSGIFPDLFKIE